MNFKKATDSLFAPVTHHDLARALGVSVPSVRQARLADGAKAHRAAPPGWETVVSRLAEDRARHFRRLAEQLKKPRK